MTLWCLAPCVISEEGQMHLQGLVYKVPGLQGRALCKLSRKPRPRCKAMAQNFISEAFKNKRSWPTELQQPWELPTWLIQNYWKVCFFCHSTGYLFANSHACKSVKLCFKPLGSLWEVQVQIFISRRKTPCSTEDTSAAVLPGWGQAAFQKLQCGSARQQWSLVVSNGAYLSRSQGPFLTVWSGFSLCLFFT